MPQNKIALSGEQTGIVREKYDAGEAITPGELLEVQADGDVNPHSTAAANAQKVFALEPLGVEAAAGTKIIDTDYATGDTVRCWWPQRGAEVFAFLDNTSANVEEGVPLESVGNGNLRTLTTDAATDDQQRDSIVAYAAEDVTSPGSGRVRIRVYAA